MSWLRIDDTFVDHPKLVSLGGIPARWAFLELLSYCAKHKTDGYFPAAISESHRRLTPAFIAHCVEVGLVDKEEDGSLRIHDFAVYNPGKDPTGAVRQQRWRNAQRNGGVTENVTGIVTPSRARDPVPKTTSQSQDQEHDVKSRSSYVVTEARPAEHDDEEPIFEHAEDHELNGAAPIDFTTILSEWPK